MVRACSLPRLERSSLAGEVLGFGTVRVLAGMGVECMVLGPAGEQKAPIGCGGLMVGGIRLSQTSRRWACGHGHWSLEVERHIEADMWVLAGSCSDRFAVAQQGPEDMLAIGTVQEEAA